MSVPDKKDGKWQLEEFRETGEHDISHVVMVIEESGKPLRRRTAIDFGCGVGRLTQLLAERFELALGVDISSTIIDAAIRINRDLSIIPDALADLVFNHTVLRHMKTVQGARVRDISGGWPYHLGWDLAASPG